jgi:predicted ribosomally synthesized peptide with SipW-like signal peptide
MTVPTCDHQRTRRHAQEKILVNTNRKRVALALGALVTVASIGVGAASLAYFASTATVPANTFSTGSVILSTNPTTALVTFAAIAPGDAVSAPISVSNDGTLALRYAISSVSTNVDTKGLKDQLVLTIKSGVSACNNIDWVTDGTQIYSGDLDSTAGLLVGNATTGADTGDRTLAASANETLCFHVSLPSSTGAAFQLAATTATFTFAGEQTKNN